jgi:hypothetical protein
VGSTDVVDATLSRIAGQVRQYASAESKNRILSLVVDWGTPIAGVVGGAAVIGGESYKWVAGIAAAVATGLSGTNTARRPRERAVLARQSKEAFEGFDNEVRVQLGKIADKFHGHFEQEKTARLNYIETAVVRLNALIETETKRRAS